MSKSCPCQEEALDSLNQVCSDAGSWEGKYLSDVLAKLGIQ